MKDKDASNMLRNAIILSCIVATIVAVALIVEQGKGSYSALYIDPDSYSNYVNGTEVFFTYGVQCFEAGKTKYLLEIFLEDKVVAAKTFEMISGEKKWNQTIQVSEDTQFPVKVKLILTANDKEYETHFWLKDWMD